MPIRERKKMYYPAGIKAGKLFGVNFIREKILHLLHVVFDYPCHNEHRVWINNTTDITKTYTVVHFKK